jgi:hypothetical protein
MSQTKRPLVKRVLLYSLVGSVALGASLAILFVLLNTWSWFEVRVLLTTIVVAVASLCVMACELARTPQGRNVLPYAGFSFTLLSAAMLLIGMWADIRGDEFWRVCTCLATFAVAIVHVCLISVAPLSRKFKWVYYIAMQISFGLAFLFSMMVFEAFRVDEGISRAMIALAIVDTALTLVIPILSRISKVENPAELAESPLELRNIAAIDHEIDLLRQRIAELERLRTKYTIASDSVSIVNIRD